MGVNLKAATSAYADFLRAIGVDESNRYLYMIVVDKDNGKDANYKSQGVNLFELGDLMKEIGVYTGISLDVVVHRRWSFLGTDGAEQKRSVPMSSTIRGIAMWIGDVKKMKYTTQNALLRCILA